MWCGVSGPEGLLGDSSGALSIGLEKAQKREVGVGVEDILVDGSQLCLYGGQLPQLEDYVNNPFLVKGYFEIPINPFLTITPALVYGEAICVTTMAPAPTTPASTE